MFLENDLIFGRVGERCCYDKLLYFFPESEINVHVHVFLLAVVACLLDVYNSKNMRLKKACRNFLTKRVRLWRLAGTVSFLMSSQLNRS